MIASLYHITSYFMASPRNSYLTPQSQYIDTIRLTQMPRKKKALNSCSLYVVYHLTIRTSYVFINIFHVWVILQRSCSANGIGNAMPQCPNVPLWKFQKIYNHVLIVSDKHHLIGDILNSVNDKSYIPEMCTSNAILHDHWLRRRIVFNTSLITLLRCPGRAPGSVAMFARALHKWREITVSEQTIPTQNRKPLSSEYVQRCLSRHWYGKVTTAAKHHGRTSMWQKQLKLWFEKGWYCISVLLLRPALSLVQSSPHGEVVYWLGGRSVV